MAELKLYVQKYSHLSYPDSELIHGFEWDRHNSLKSKKKHGLTVEVIESFFRGQIWITPDTKHSSREERYLAIGSSTEMRPMVVAFTFRTKDGRRLIRPISARYMHFKEARKYEEAFATAQK